VPPSAALRSVLRSKGFAWLESDDAHSYYWSGPRSERTRARPRATPALAPARACPRSPARTRLARVRARVLGIVVCMDRRVF
jgi:hypothetical protein